MAQHVPEQVYCSCGTFTRIVPARGYVIGLREFLTACEVVPSLFFYGFEEKCVCVFVGFLGDENLQSHWTGYDTEESTIPIFSPQHVHRFAHPLKKWSVDRG